MRFVIVYHRNPPDFGVERKCVNRCELEAVALVVLLEDVDSIGALEIAFRLTNTVNKAWWENVGVSLLHDGKRKLLGKGGIRSTSCGDVVEYDGVFYLCDKFSWVELMSDSAKTLVPVL